MRTRPEAGTTQIRYVEARDIDTRHIPPPIHFEHQASDLNRGRVRNTEEETIQ